MACKIIYKGISYDESDFKNQIERYIAINQLFESDSNLANQIYEALGFKDNAEKKYNKLENLTYENFLKLPQNEIEDILKYHLHIFPSNKPSVGKPLLFGAGYSELPQNFYPELKFNKIFIKYENGQFNLYKNRIDNSGITKQKSENNLTKEEEDKILSEELLGYSRFNREWELHKEDISSEDLSKFIQYSGKLEKETYSEEDIKKAFDWWYNNERSRLDNPKITIKRKQQALQLYSQYLESLNKPNTNPVLQGNQKEQLQKFKELQERLNNKEFLEGAKGAYESTPALQELGTQEEYNDYIARVSLGILKNPSSGEYNYDSKVKDIVYHGTSNPNIENFKAPNNIRGYWFGNKETAERYSSFRTQDRIDTEISEKYDENKEIASNKEYQKSVEDKYKETIYPILLNIKNPRIIKEETHWKEIGQIVAEEYINTKENPEWINNWNKQNVQKWIKVHDAVIAKDVDEKETFGINEEQIIVFEPQQIHILGNKQDIEGFKEFVNKPTQTVESYRAQEQAELSQRIPNIENYKIDGKVVKSLITDENDLKIYNEIYDKYDALITPLLNDNLELTNTNPNEILEDKIKENALFSFLKQFDFDVKAFNSEYGYTNKETLDILNRVLYVDINNFENDFKNQFVDFLQFFLKYDSEYNNLLKRYTKEEIKNSFLKNLEVENKKINAFKKLIDKVLNVLRLKKDYLNYYTTDIINRIYNNDATVLNYYKGLRPGSTSLSTLSSYDKNIVKDPQAEEIINAFADEFSLTGSIVLGEQGTTYTSDNNPFHDIDYQASGKTKEEIEEIVYKKFPNAQFFRSIPNEDYTTYTYIVPTGDYKIENLDIRAKEKNGKIYKDVYGYDVVDKDGKVVGTYRMEKQKTGKITIFGNEEKKKNEDERGVKAKIVDFFQSDTEKQYFVKTYKGKNIKMAFWTDIMKAKLEYLRPKDIHDILLFNKEKLPQELKKQTNETKNKIAINNLFKSLPILGTIGTQEQYLRYFNTIDSNTSVPVIVYRAVRHEDFELKNKSFFTDDPEYAKKYGSFLKPYKLNILNPYISKNVGIHRATIDNMLENPIVDGIIGKESLNNVRMKDIMTLILEAQEEGRYLSFEGAVKKLAGPLTDVNSFVTTNKNQIYELGTDTDIDSFKNFVQNDPGPKELNKKSLSLYSKIFDISEDEINDHLKNCS